MTLYNMFLCTTVYKVFLSVYNVFFWLGSSETRHETIEHSKKLCCFLHTKTNCETYIRAFKKYLTEKELFTLQFFISAYQQLL